LGNSIEQSWFIRGMVKATSDMWLKGWDERNGGNVSLRLYPEDLEPFKYSLVPRESAPIGETIPGIGGQYFLVTGSGKYFRNVQLDPEENLAVIRVSEDGQSYQTVWGLREGGVPTSELSAHLNAHEVRQRVTNGKARVIMHCHATNLIALSYVLEQSSAVMTRALWEGSTECLVVFPDGVGVIPWMVPGTRTIGAATAESMERHPMTLWPFHGIFGSGSTLDETFGLIDTAEKSAEILVKVISMGGMKHAHRIRTEELLDLAARFRVQPMPEAIAVEHWWSENGPSI
jgi:rhamnulose-1-phosphate aldolase